MKTTKIIFVALLTLLFFGLRYYFSSRFDKSQFTCNDLEGTWNANGYPVQIQFAHDSMFYTIRSHKEQIITYGVPYSCNKRSDTLYVQTENNFLNFILLAQEHKVIFCDFKTHIGLNRIDEVFQICKKGKEEGNASASEKRYQPDVFILPAGFLGMCEVAFNQKGGSEVVYNKSGSRVFRFTDSLPLFLQTKARESIYNVALNNIRFYYSDKKGHLKLIPVVPKNHFRTEVKFDSDKVYVVNLGFNQRGRAIFDKRLHKNISGNIAFFQVVKAGN